MIIGTNLISDNPSVGTTYFSPWFPRGGNRAVFSCEVIAAADTTNDISTFTITVQSKDAEEGDNDAVTLGSANSISMASDELITSFEAGAKLSDAGTQGMKELVRFKYIVKSQTDGHAWVHFRMGTPAWLHN